jgi:chaperonin GroEL (HSP60 family)
MVGPQRAVYKSFSNALESLPLALCTNSGFHPQQVTEVLRSTSALVGLSVHSLQTIDPHTEGILDSYRAKVQVLSSVVDMVTVLLRVDKMIRAVDPATLIAQEAESLQLEEQRKREEGQKAVEKDHKCIPYCVLK